MKVCCIIVDYFKLSIAEMKEIALFAKLESQN
jgi:hypothetical protein